MIFKSLVTVFKCDVVNNTVITKDDFNLYKSRIDGKTVHNGLQSLKFRQIKPFSGEFYVKFSDIKLVTGKFSRLSNSYTQINL